MRNFAFVVTLVCIALSGCTRSARLYPANDIATATGVLTADFKSYGSGHGDIKIIMPDGELLNGEYSLVRGGAIGFGNVYGSVYGSAGLSSFSGSSNSYVTPGGSPGTASLFGDKGTSMLCEFYNDNFSGHVNGGCKSSRNAIYRLQF
ncbi:hypothetical protein [Pseudomonas sp. 6D_7.1_Bac1]|uniref:hypothetical protein n=1 Tax=Pseudomonas sp. 6D_7.1_Bac1 TaxID=2971615 RepID=UPI0021C5EA37|nr:hypothetical protein [Pseudomonas sp. 6D_7.1_Bac1]MCU1751749.1 hypothetical protein [Pseudomonas sp. 6D_7.1_Bac1]